MKKNLKTIILFISVVLIGIIQFSSIGFASELNFSVEALIPDNQRDKTKTYFDLRVEPNTEQTIEINLRNDTNNEVVVEPSINTATTNLNGVVEYGETKAKQDKTLPINLKDIVTVAKEVSIPAKSSLKVPLNIKMPETKFDGIISGGITIKEKDSVTDSKGSKSQGLAINNKYAYVVALLINQTDKEVKPKLELNEVTPAQVNARNVINANIQNITAAYVNEMSVDAKVIQKGKTKTLYENTKNSMQMAPNSNFEYPISLNGEKLEAGDYTLILNVEANEGKWSFTKNFTINGKDAKKFNQQDVSIKKDNTWIYLLASLFLILIVAYLVFIINRKRKEEKRKEEARKRALAHRKKKRKKL